MKPTEHSVLGYALMGLIHQKPSSGYDLRKTFAETAMGNYSSSPGAIYPALERLEKRGSDSRRGEREARDCAAAACIGYRLRASGNSSSGSRSRLTRDEVMRGSGELMLRFAFMEQALGPDAAIAFLRKFRSRVRDLRPWAEGIISQDNGPQMPLSGMLALDSGIRDYETLQQWTEYAIREVSKQASANKKPFTRKSKSN